MAPLATIANVSIIGVNRKCIQVRPPYRRGHFLSESRDHRTTIVEVEFRAFTGFVTLLTG